VDEIARANGYISMMPRVELEPSRTRLVATGSHKLFVLAGTEYVCLQVWEQDGGSGMTCDTATALAEKDVLVLSGKGFDGRVHYHALVRDGIAALEVADSPSSSRRVPVVNNAASGVLPAGTARFEWTAVGGDRRAHSPLAGRRDSRQR
jgi:hypothetical protein